MCLSFSNRMTPRIENIASKEINQFIQILINHTSFTQKIDTHKLYKKENNSISFQMNYINDIASNYIHNLEETLLKLEEGSYQENNHSPYNKKLLKSINKKVLLHVYLSVLLPIIFSYKIEVHLFPLNIKHSL